VVRSVCSVHRQSALDVSRRSKRITGWQTSHNWDIATLSSRPLNKTFEQDLWTRSLNKIFEQDLSSRPLNKIFEQDLWTRSLNKTISSKTGNEWGIDKSRDDGLQKTTTHCHKSIILQSLQKFFGGRNKKKCRTVIRRGGTYMWQVWTWDISGPLHHLRWSYTIE